MARSVRETITNEMNETFLVLDRDHKENPSRGMRWPEDSSTRRRRRGETLRNSAGGLAAASWCAGSRGECMCKFTYVHVYVRGQRVCATAHSHDGVENQYPRPTDRPTYRRWRRDAQTRRSVSVVVVAVVDVRSFVLVHPLRLIPSRCRRGRHQDKRSAGRTGRSRNRDVNRFLPRIVKMG